MKYKSAFNKLERDVNEFIAGQPVPFDLCNKDGVQINEAGDLLTPREIEAREYLLALHAKRVQDADNEFQVVKAI